MKTVLGVVVGAMSAFLCIFAIEAASHLLFPLPPGTDLSDPAEMARLMEVMPATALTLVLLAWFAGALVGAWAANTMAKRALAGWIVGLLVVAAGISTMIMIPHPAWMWAAGIGLPLAGAWISQRLTKVVM